ncbi:potassium channel family protein [Maricaulis sp.]|uniref:potassium channel family protein n=1 Tax=Maricaulis sp. TaxID=1486257 RepID=UPI0026030D09|nr:potassium channel family protein [Maricaulis sp.]
MGAALLVSGLMAVGTVIIHMLGLMVLMGFMRARSDHLHPRRSAFRQSVFILMVVLGLFLIHAIEMLAYAALYYGLGEFLTFEEALYFSVSTFTTLGMGDIYIESQWRLVAAIEGFNGFLLIGWSTAFLVTVIGRLRAIEFDWLDRLGDEDD